MNLCFNNADHMPASLLICCDLGIYYVDSNALNILVTFCRL